MKPCAFETERTNQGEQALVPGVKPIRERDRLQVLMEAPLAPKRAQRPCNVGLFDEDARNQLDLLIHVLPADTRRDES